MSLVAPVLALQLTGSAVAAPALHPELSGAVRAWVDEGQPATLDEERLASVGLLIDWLAAQQAKGEPAPLLFVCTHNSRRSQMGQAWARAAAMELGLDQVSTWSGGTEATAFNPRAVTALRSHGFVIDATGRVVAEDNVVYTLGYGPETHDEAFSKVYGDAFNPSTGFAAVMVCSSADSSCPMVQGADLRVALPYLDPKQSDGTPEEAATYRAKSEEIGREMAWLMQAVARRVSAKAPSSEAGASGPTSSPKR